MKDIEWIDSDCAEFQKYGLSSAFMKSLKEFYTAKKNFLLCPNEDTRYEMKFLFQHVHSALKSECAKHIISPYKLQELTELLKRGV